MSPLRFGSLILAMMLVHATAPWAQAPSRPAGDEGAWHVLEVHGGRAALDALGVPPSIDRASTLTDLIRRLHFSTEAPTKLNEAVLKLKMAAADLTMLRGAIAAAASGGTPPSLAIAGQRDGRRLLEAAVGAAGLALREDRGRVTVELDRGSRSSALRDRLAMLGLDVEALRRRLDAGGSLTVDVPTIALPLPLSHATWNTIIFERTIAPGELVAEIISDPSARLLYHGLMGLDAETRRWFATQPDLLRRLYRNPEAVRAFTLFGAAIRIAGGSVIVPGGQVAARRWRGLLGVNVDVPERFVRRLFELENGRIAGLYFTVAAVEEPRRRFILDMIDRPKDLDARIRSLADSFANCYGTAVTSYPFVLRSYDASVLLAEVGLTPTGHLAGPAWPAFWTKALSGDNLPENPAAELRGFNQDGPVDGAWMVDALCRASPADRPLVFAAFLFGHRAFANIQEADVPDALVAVRARRLYPAVMMAVEQAGVKTSRTFAAIARHAERVAAVDNPGRAIIATEQFQGALTLTVGAIVAQTLTVDAGARLMESLAALPLEGEQYRGRVVRWFTGEWLPAVRKSLAPAVAARVTTIEAVVTEALAGPSADASQVIPWEGQQYRLDFGSTIRDRLTAVRKRQGGVTLDSVIELDRLRAELQQPSLTLERVSLVRDQLRAWVPRLTAVPLAEEFGTEAPDVGDRIDRTARDLAEIREPGQLRRAATAAEALGAAIDLVFGQALASWAYAPHVGGADSAMLVGGDPSSRHQFGVNLALPGRLRRRWEVPLQRAEDGTVTGALIGLEATLARWSLRRMATDSVPPAPTIIGNDLLSFYLTAALSNPRRLTDEDRDDIAHAYHAGTAMIEGARLDPNALDAVAASGALSPWTREALSWMVANEPDRVVEKFSAAERVRIGGLRSIGVDEWGSASLLSGCLCIKMPPARVPELVVGRAADGLIAAQTADPMLRLAVALAEMKLPAALASPVMAYAMRDFLDHVSPSHSADFDAFVRQARAIDRRSIEDYLGAIAAVGPLRPARGQR